MSEMDGKPLMFHRQGGAASEPRPESAWHPRLVSFQWRMRLQNRHISHQMANRDTRRHRSYRTHKLEAGIADQVPALWEDSRILAQQVERTWLTTLCGQDLVSQEVIEREVQALRRQLLGANPSPLESLLVDRICACWLAVQHAEIHAAKRLTTHSVALSTAQEQRLDKVHRRFLTAIRELARVRKLLRPETKFQVNIGAQQIVS